MEDEVYDLREQIFHNTIRENVIFLLLFLLLYLSSYAIIDRFRRSGIEDYFSTDEDEATVYKISLWLCTFSLSVSMCAALLLPFSIASNEVLLIYPSSFYVKWLNHSLIQGLWNHVFLFSNVSLFILLPFAYLFTESEGFSGYRKCLMSRVFETSVVLLLLSIAMLGFTYIFSNLIDYDNTSIFSFLSLWSYYLPFLYSCISFLGVVTLLLCTPLGFARLFGVVSSFLVKPQFLRNIEEEYDVASIEEESLRRRLKQAKATGKSYLNPPPMYEPKPVRRKRTETGEQEFADDDESLMALRNGKLQTGLAQRLETVAKKRQLLAEQRNASSLRRNVVYPLAMLTLLALTVITVLMVVRNFLQLLVGFKALPLTTKPFTVGISSLSMLGAWGAGLEVVVLLYLAVTSCVGLYTLPFVRQVRPRMRRTPFTHIVVNCIILLVLSSALPVLARTLGITNFDLLGHFGRIEWLGNFMIVLSYNIIFVLSASLCLINKFTHTVRKDLYAWLLGLLSYLVSCFKKSIFYRIVTKLRGYFSSGPEEALQQAVKTPAHSAKQD
ncbi:protein Lilipod [Nilaparvata lugens]|uniref:protein Lilipod n=1 Tax=Nilaparvata lugens TaxID=108931 RepID=UPI00193CB9CC|nr:protein Lilipod [Nilaparvata lugens]